MVEARQLFISCEHGGNEIPDPYRHLFQDSAELLGSHRGYDPGALPLARGLAEGLGVPLKTAVISRLLVDLNRSPSNPALFSPASRSLSKEAQQQLMAQHYWPYRSAVGEKIAGLIACGRQVIHLSVHSFAPVLAGRTRNADLGLLYDPQRSQERPFCLAWKELLQRRQPELKIRCNYPYRGISDGLVRTLRQRFSDDDYLGVELELNQALLAGKKSFPRPLQQALRDSLQELISDG